MYIVTVPHTDDHISLCLHIIYEVYSHTQGKMDQRAVAVAMLEHVSNDHVVQSEDLTPEKQNTTPLEEGSSDDEEDDMIGAINETSFGGPVEKPDADLDGVDDIDNVMLENKHQGIGADIVTFGMNEEGTDEYANVNLNA